MRMTKHAHTRMQQRAIPPLILEWLDEYGHCQHDSYGATVYYFDKRGRRRLSRDVGTIVTRRLGDLLDAYMVKKDDQVITVGHRYRRINRN